MPNPDVLPRKDIEFDSFQDNLMAKVTANKAAWKIPQTAIDMVTPLQAAWVAAWLIAKVKANCTPAQTTAKTLARKKYERVLRNFIQAYIFRNRAMTDKDVVECGLKPRKPGKTRVAVPVSVPFVQLYILPGNILEVRFFRKDDEDGAIRRSRPKGVRRIEFAFNFITQPASTDDCTESISVTRSPLQIGFQPNLRGQKIWYYARWINTREEPGPWTDLKWFVL